MVDLGPIPSDGDRQQAGRRPALIVDADPTGTDNPMVTIIPFTSKLAASRFGPNVQVDDDPTNGLNQPSILLLFQIRAIDENDFIHRLGVLGNETMQEVNASLRTMLGL